MDRGDMDRSELRPAGRRRAACCGCRPLAERWFSGAAPGGHDLNAIAAPDRACVKTRSAPMITQLRIRARAPMRNRLQACPDRATMELLRSCPVAVRCFTQAG